MDRAARLPVPVRTGLKGAVVGLAVVVPLRLLRFPVALADVLVAPLGCGLIVGGTVALHLAAARGPWTPTRWGRPTTVVFVGYALLWSVGWGNAVVGVAVGLLAATLGVWLMPKVVDRLAQPD